MDIWVMPSADNAEAVMRALARFGAPMHQLTAQDLQEEGTVFQIGVAPRRIDTITTASGLRLDDAFGNAVSADIEGIQFRVLSIEDLIRNKRVTGRMKDLADVEALEALKASEYK